MRRTAKNQLLALLAAAAMLAACRGSRAGNAGQLRIAVANDPKTFDPYLAAESSSGLVRDLTAGVLLRIHRLTGELQPELAESYRVVDEGKAIVFRLRAGLKFSDGSPLTAQEAAAALRHLLATKEAQVGDALKEGNPSISTPGPLDLEVRYAAPKPRIDRIFDEIAIVPPNPAKLPATAGPFFVAEHQPGQYVRLARNPNYWNRPLPRLDSIRIDIQSNHDIEVTRFLRGELQVLDRMSPERYDQVAASKELSGAAHSTGASLNSQFFWFNQAPVKSLPDYKRQWFTSAGFRHAVSLAVHREDIVRIVYRGHAHVASGPTSPANRLWFDSGLKPFPADPEKALRMLADAGFAFDGKALRDRGGHAVEFSLLTQAGNKERENMAHIVADDLAKIGMRVNVVTLDFNSLVSRFSTSLDYEAVLLDFDEDPDPVDQLNVWLSSGPTHPWYPNQKSPATAWEAEIDRLARLQISEPSREARKKAFDRMQEIMVEQEPMIYLVNPDYLYAAAPSVQGLQPATVPPQLWWNVAQISLRQAER